MQRSSELPEGVLLTEPQFTSEALRLGKKLAQLSAAQNAQLHSVSAALAQATTLMHQAWWEDFPEGLGAPAALSYTGDAYAGLQAQHWPADTWRQAQEHLRIGSGLYGCLRPTDRILPYRCEMGLSWPLGAASGPTSFWKNRLTPVLARELQGDWLLDLSSGEYGAVLDATGLKAPIIRCDFREIKNGKPVFVSVFGKRARGSMARHVLAHSGPLLEVVDSFSTDGYALNLGLSTPTLRVFTR
jgi:cytoplasmic iron level regulating protein YaaA (DUF328/UPF0246 family)